MGDWFNLSTGLNYSVQFEYWDRNFTLGDLHPRPQYDLWQKHRDKFQQTGTRDGFTIVDGLRADPVHTINIGLGLARDSRDNFLEPHRGSYLKVNLNMITLGYRVAKWNVHAEWNKTFLWKLTFHIATDLFTLGPLFEESGFVYPEELHYFFYQEELRSWSTSHINNHRMDIVLPHYNGKSDWGNLSFDDLLAGNARGGSKIRHVVEIRWPFAEGILGGSLFLDAGNIARRELTTRWIGYLYDPTIYMFSWGFGIRIHIPQFPIRFYFPWRFVYNPSTQQLEYWETKADGTPDFVFTVAGFF